MTTKLSNGGNADLARFSKIRCEQNKLETFTLVTKVVSPFSVDEIELQLEGQPDAATGSRLKATTGKSIVWLDGNRLLSGMESSFAKFCETEQKGLISLELIDKDPFIKTLSTTLGAFSPDCELAPDPAGFSCVMEQLEADSVIEHLQEFRRVMVRSWSRQPYILTRRLSLTLTTAQALQAKDANPKLDQLCRIIAHADPVELPLAFASKRWQDAVCFDKRASRREGAAIGMTKALGEIEFLRQLFERSSKLGTMLVRIPFNSSPTKDLWVNLKPGADVATNLVQESQAIGAKISDSTDHDFNVAKSCWHPIFADQPDLMTVARYLDIVGESEGSYCVQNSAAAQNSGEAVSAPHKYLAESITSETEFVVTNGHSKMLRLPSGSYSYEIRAHSETLGWDESTDQLPPQSSKGEISWSNKRPSVTIKTW